MTDDKKRGLYNKYNVARVDGNPDGKHTTCLYFVLDLDHDEHALPALVAYIDSCEKEYPVLAAELSLEVIRRTKP